MAKGRPDGSAVRGMGLKRPCKHCPFRSDVPRYLYPQRYRQIAAELLEGGSFICHETIHLEEAVEGGSFDGGRACAGAMIWLQAQGRPNQLMQVMERLGVFDPTQLDRSASVYRSREEFEVGCSEAMADSFDAEPASR